MSSADPKLVAKIARRLMAGVNATTHEESDRRLDRVGEWAARSEDNMNVAFAATQLLRDLDKIDWAEAAYLFSALLDHQLLRELGDVEPDPDLARAIETATPTELIMAAMSHNATQHAVEFHRTRGEEELAAMILDQPEEYATLCATGSVSLIEDKPHVASDDAAGNRRSGAAGVAERVIALSATETFKEWYPAWLALCDAMHKAEPAAAVAAIQSARGIGMISFEESLVLLDMAIDSLVSAEAEVDRECRRLERAAEAYDAEHGIDPETIFEPEREPFALRLLHHRRQRRLECLTAKTLRRFGEHRVANLLSTNPEEYARICAEIDVGGRPHDARPDDVQ